MLSYWVLWKCWLCWLCWLFFLLGNVSSKRDNICIMDMLKKWKKLQNISVQARRQFRTGVWRDEFLLGSSPFLKPVHWMHFFGSGISSSQASVQGNHLLDTCICYSIKIVGTCATLGRNTVEYTEYLKNGSFVKKMLPVVNFARWIRNFNQISILTYKVSLNFHQSLACFA